MSCDRERAACVSVALTSKGGAPASERCALIASNSRCSRPDSAGGGTCGGAADADGTSVDTAAAALTSGTAGTGGGATAAVGTVTAAVTTICSAGCGEATALLRVSAA